MSANTFSMSFCLTDAHRVATNHPTIYYVPEFITEQEAEMLWKQVYAAPKPKWTTLLNRRLQNWGGLPSAKGMIQEALPSWLTNVTRKLDEMGCFDGHAANHVLINEYQPGQGIMPHEDGPFFYPVIANITLGSHTMLDLYPKPRSESNSTTSPVGPTPTLSCQDSGEHAATMHSEPDVEQTTRQASAPTSRSKMLTVDSDSTSAVDPELGQARRHKVGKLLLEPRSLVIMRDDVYQYLHGIDEITEDMIDGSVLNLTSCSRAWTRGSVVPRSTRVSLTIRFAPKVIKLPGLKFGTSAKW